jgi:hypothetical protein
VEGRLPRLKDAKDAALMTQLFSKAGNFAALVLDNLKSSELMLSGELASLLPINFNLTLC